MPASPRTHSPRCMAVAVLAAGASLLAACGHYPPTAASPSYPNVYPSRSPTTVGTAPVSLEYGRVTSIEYVPAGTQSASGPNVIGAVVGGVAGAVLGRQIGGGSGRDAATVLGGVAGAAAGSQVGRDTQGMTTAPMYRVMIQTDQGIMRTYEVNATGDLRVGDRVRIENNVIYRS